MYRARGGRGSESETQYTSIVRERDTCTVRSQPFVYFENPICSNVSPASSSQKFALHAYQQDQATFVATNNASVHASRLATTRGHELERSVLNRSHSPL